MKRGFILELVPKDGFDITKVVEDYANGRHVDLSACELKQHLSIVDSFRPESVDYIAKYGLSALFRREPLMEVLVAPGHKFLRRPIFATSFSRRALGHNRLGRGRSLFLRAHNRHELPSLD